MKNTAIYPGTFDPITNGHVDVIKKALKFCDKVIVGVSDGNEKNFLFPIDERCQIVSKALFGDLKFHKQKVKVIKFKSLTTSLCRKYKSNLILRGLRAISDFEYEVQLASINRSIEPSIESVFMSPAEEYSFLSSSIVKDIARHNGDTSKYVHPTVSALLREKYSK